MKIIGNVTVFWIWVIASLFPTPSSSATNSLSLFSSSSLFADGEQYDPDLGLYHLRARYYNPATGRFWTMDSWEAPLRKPLGLHKFVYTKNNPSNMVDPTGHFGSFSMGGMLGSMAIQGAIGAGIGGGINYAITGDLSEAGEAAAVGFGVGFVGAGILNGIRHAIAVRTAAAEVAAGIGSGVGTGATVLLESEAVVGIVINGRVISQSVMNIGSGHVQAARAASALVEGAAKPTLVQGAEAFTAQKVGGEIIVVGSGTFHGINRLLTVSDETVSAARAFFK